MCGSGLFWHIQLNLSELRIWGIWRLDQCLGLFVVFLKLSLCHFWVVEGALFNAGEAAVLRECLCLWGCVWSGAMCKWEYPTRIPGPRTQGFAEDYCIWTRWSVSFIQHGNGLNGVGDRIMSVCLAACLWARYSHHTGDQNKGWLWREICNSPQRDFLVKGTRNKHPKSSLSDVWINIVTLPCQLKCFFSTACDCLRKCVSQCHHGKICSKIHLGGGERHCHFVFLAEASMPVCMSLAGFCQYDGCGRSQVKVLFWKPAMHKNAEIFITLNLLCL